MQLLKGRTLKPLICPAADHVTENSPAPPPQALHMVLANGVARSLEPSLSWDWAKALLPSLPAPSVPQALLWILLFSPSPFFFLLVTLSSPGPFCLGFRPSPFLSLSPPPFLLPVSALADLPLFFPCCLPWPPSKGGQLGLSDSWGLASEATDLGALPWGL